MRLAWLLLALAVVVSGCAFDEGGPAGATAEDEPDRDAPDPSPPVADPADAGAPSGDGAGRDDDDGDDDDDDDGASGSLDGLPFGADCAAGDECASGFCERFRGKDRCTQYCARDDDCPAGARGCEDDRKLCEPSS